MELPDLPLALIREYSQPRVGKEARAEYRKYVSLNGPSPAVLRKMVTPHGVSVVSNYNREAEAIEDLLLVYRVTPFRTTQSSRLRGLLNEQYARQRICNRDIRILLVGEEAVRADEALWRATSEN
jgi:hypothetical protein